MLAFHTKISIVIAFLCLLSGCAKSVWTADELKEWYSTTDDNPLLHGPLYYRGTDNQYHHFICRSLDDWCFFKVNKNELPLSDVRPLINIFFGSPFPGYYVVDPAHGYKRIEEMQSPVRRR
jgi:hypothetical protein